MKTRSFSLFISALLITQVGFAQSTPLNSVNSQQTTEDLTNAITGEAYLPLMKEPIPNLTFETNKDGEIITITNHVTVFSNPTHQKITPQVVITENGAVGSHPQLGHSIEFDGNLNRSDAVMMHLPATGVGDVTLQGHVIAIGVIDAAGHQAWLGLIKDCSGFVDKDQPNVVHWPDAFTGIKADVVFVYGQTYFEQLVVLRENPVIPPEIDQATARLFAMSEFYQTPEPRKESRKVKLRIDKDLENHYGSMMLDDEILDWGWMRMADGNAFVWQKSSGMAAKPSVPTSKTWFKNGDRVFLAEYADYLSLKPALNDLAELKTTKKATTECTEAQRKKGEGRLSRKNLCCRYIL